MNAPRWKIVMERRENTESCIIEATGTGVSILPHRSMAVRGIFLIHPETGEEHSIGASDWDVELSIEAEGDMILAAQECPVEVGGRHRVIIDKENGRFCVPEIWIPTQVCAGDCFRLYGSADHEAMLEAQQKGYNWDEFRLGCWHSHGGYSAVLSRQDLRSTQEHMELLFNDWVHSGYRWRDHEIQVELVVNRQGEISARFSTAVPAIIHFPIRVVRQEGVTDDDVDAYMEANRERVRELVFKKVSYEVGRGGELIRLSDYMERHSLYETRGPWGDF